MPSVDSKLSLYRRCVKACRRHEPTVANNITPIWYLVCVFGLNWMLDDHIFDYLHGKGTQLSYVARLICWFMSGQMMINWIFLCTVKSNYENSSENNAKRLEHEKSKPQFASEGIEYDELKERRPTSGTGNWAVITQYTGDEVKRIAYPYWGWKPCIVCSCYKPPRCHHCPLCSTCVLKRDHHCFFARQCVGLKNQRYFIVFNFWAVLLTSFVIPQLIHYTRLAIWPQMSVLELFLPFTCISYLVGWTEFYILALVSQNWSMLWFIATAGIFVFEQYRCVDRSQTSYELDHYDRIIKTNCKSRYERFACVFGRNNIWINFLIPYHWASKPVDDGITWDSIKMD